MTRGINSVLAQAPRKATGKIHGSGFGVDDDGGRSVIPSVKVSLTGATDLAVEGDDQCIFSIQFSSARMRSLPKALAWQQRETVRRIFQRTWADVTRQNSLWSFDMKPRTKNALSALAIMASAAAIGAAQTSAPLPSADDVAARMMEFDAQRQAQMTGYTAFRHYSAANKRRHADMFVQVTCGSDGVKQFDVVSEEGSGPIRKHVFHKLLNEETEASRRGTRSGTRITPANYDFQIVGQETVETGPAYVLQVSPKTENKYLIRGKIWVDANDYSIVRIQGQPARNPSFWVRSVHFVHTYQKVGPFWFASSTHTTSEIRIFGESELTIENSGYALVPAKDRAAESESQARLVP